MLSCGPVARLCILVSTAVVATAVAGCSAVQVVPIQMSRATFVDGYIQQFYFSEAAGGMTPDLDTLSGFGIS